MNENGINGSSELFENGSENVSSEIIESSEENPSVLDGENDLSVSVDSSESSESSSSDFQEVMDAGTDEAGIYMESEDGSLVGGNLEVEETDLSGDVVAVVEQLEVQNTLLEEQNVLLESVVMFLSMIVFILMFKVCDRFISRIWSSIRSMGGSK